MRTTRQTRISERIGALIDGFPAYVAAFTNQPAFRRAGQLEFHRQTIAARRRASSAVNAIHNPDFTRLLYCTLEAWGIGSRASRLLPLPQFEQALRNCESKIAEVESLMIDQVNLDIDQTGSLLSEIIRDMQIVNNIAPLVPNTKALHHILPDLVVPMDRKFTQTFFGWHNPEFQYGQADCFVKAFAAFARIARAVNPVQYVDDG